MPDEPISVYVIECAGYAKIGIAADPIARVLELNTGSPIRAELYRHRTFASRVIAREIEGRLHRIFRSRRTNGEWFDITPAEAWEALKRQKPLRLVNPKARHDSAARWETDEPADLTNLLTR